MSALPAERRGEIHIPDRVLARIAERAAREVEGVVEVSRPRRGPWGAATRATTAGGPASVRLNVSVAYPTPLRTFSDRLRRHVARRITEMTGITVDHVDVEVTSLVTAPARETP